MLSAIGRNKDSLTELTQYLSGNKEVLTVVYFGILKNIAERCHDKGLTISAYNTMAINTRWELNELYPVDKDLYASVTGYVRDTFMGVPVYIKHPKTVYEALGVSVPQGVVLALEANLELLRTINRLSTNSKYLNANVDDVIKQIIGE